MASIKVMKSFVQNWGRQVKPFSCGQMLKIFWSGTPKIRFMSIKFVDRHLPKMNWDGYTDYGVYAELEWPKNSNNFRNIVPIKKKLLKTNHIFNTCIPQYGLNQEQKVF